MLQSNSLSAIKVEYISEKYIQITPLFRSYSNPSSSIFK